MAAIVKRRVLIVEDSPLSMKLFSELVSARGHDVLRAETGDEGVRLAYEHRPDLILTDICLPDASGLTLTRLFKHDHRTKAIPVVVLSASGIGVAEVLQSGCDAYLPKPIPINEFLRTIDGILAPCS